MEGLTAGLILAAIAATPVTVWISGRVFIKFYNCTLDHLEESRSVGGQPLELARRQAELTADKVEIELEKDRVQIEAFRKNGSAGPPQAVTGPPRFIDPQDPLEAP